MAWIFNKEKITGSDRYAEDTFKLVGDSVIEEIVTGEGYPYIDYLKIAGGVYVSRNYYGLQSTDSIPDTEHWLMTCSTWMDYFIEVGSEDTDDIRSPEEYYTFLGDKYYTKEELVKAIEGHSEAMGGVYYYHHHKVEEHTLEISPYKKVSGKYDQSTLDKVNKILKSNGIDFVVKGDKQ